MSSTFTGWGFIGASTVAREHMLAAVRAQPGHDVVAIASGDAQRARAFADENGIRTAVDRIETLLADPSVRAVYISSTNEQHRDQALAAIAAGKHVLCEKPLAMTVDDAKGMVAAAREAGVVFATNHHLRNAATHRKVRELIAEGAIGKPLFARVFHAIYLRPQVQGWRIHSPEAGGGVIFDIGVHAADTLRFALAAEPVAAVGMAQAGFLSQNGVEDGVMAVLRMDNGVLAQIHAAYTVRHADTGFEVHGESGSIVARNVMIVRAGGEVLLRDAQGERAVPVEHEGLYTIGVRRFCEAMAGRGSPAATGEDGVRSLETAIAIAQACRTGTLVQIAAPG
ncbi:1,5-anhydro-D-fructose reductase [Variovorax sp. PBS-H4]|uniref:Gfo/Idh/MocA family protein n=1 Tax=Variovorax sp. PBS-H4 TaxID=434008 RepID=UPI00131910F3|nr:Gfo/Idh/MocA family oxidoreductase [Variovorax sp. PBS-H4]VTU25070.1 1,5-anhydro-D-fructose reductase [Variovorax sp. PBS-H4]